MGKSKIVSKNINGVCSYGCGKIAKVQFQNGKLCCSESNNSCLAIKKRNSSKQLGNNYKTGKTQIAWNKGLTSMNDDRIVSGKDHPFYQKRWGAAVNGHSKETKELLSKIMSDKMANRYTASHRAEYNGVKMESSWEIKLAKSLDENKICWVRPKPLLYVDDSGQKRRYYPDFYLPDYDVFLDPKNDYVQSLDKRKFELIIEQNNIKLYMLNEHQLDWKIIESEVFR